MTLSVSNIAWSPDEEDAAAELLARHSVTMVDLAPGRYFADPAAASDAAIAQVRRWWAERGLGIAGLHSLLFGTQGLNLFADPQGEMFDRLAAVCRIGAGLGAGALTFGSPRQRDASGLDPAAARDLASDFFRRLGNIAAREGVTICLEPNASVYGCNFMVTNPQTADIVRAVDHPAIRMQLDIGNLALNGEAPEATIAAVAPLIGHIHLSEPMLAPLGTGSSPHAAASAAIARHLPGRVMTIEMVRAAEEPALAAVERAIGFARATYERDHGEPA